MELPIVISSQQNEADIIVIGAGPAGLMAAICAARAGARVIIIDKNDQPGRKLLASGGGRCNIGNRAKITPLTNSFGEKALFVRPTLLAWGIGALEQFFSDLGVELDSPDSFHVYPKSGQSSDILQALIEAAELAGVCFMHGTAAIELLARESAVVGVETASCTLKGSAVIVATGGAGYPALGGDQSGYRLATELGHTIIEPLPALSGLVSAESWPARLAGVSLENAEILLNPSAKKHLRFNGDLLFTHLGISGPAALNASSFVARLLTVHKEVTIRIRTAAKNLDWNDLLVQWQQQHGSQTVVSLVGTHMPLRLAQTLVSLAGLDSVRAADCPRDKRVQLVQLLAEGVPLRITATLGWDKAMVTTGGVDCAQINPRTLESRVVKNLFFAGETINVDGPCGGYNLLWAFSSGHAAACSALSTLRKPDEI